MIHILHVVGGRAQFIRAAAVIASLAKHEVRQTLVHAASTSAPPLEPTFSDLAQREPDVTLRIDDGTAAERMAQFVVGLESCLVQRKPDLVLVYGASDATICAALTAVKLGLEVGYVDAGLRSGDRWSSDSVNRIVTDRLASWLFTSSDDADENLLAEGTDPGAIKLVGNVAIDSLARLLPMTRPEPLMHVLGIMNGKGPVPFALATMHKPATIDDEPTFDRLLSAVTELARDIPVVFPVQARTRKRMKDHQLKFSGLLVTEPMAYLQFLGLQQHAKCVITDSRSIQEETTYLGVPCLTVCESTEQPVTTTFGTNVLVGRDPDVLKMHARQVLAGKGKRGSTPPLWDGHAADRVAEHLVH
jgi:UDP-N-acetylglucosamine 2-epimerase (non-hydrolysing)